MRSLSQRPSFELGQSRRERGGFDKYSSDYAYEQTSLPKNAVLARNIVLGADWAYSHAAHLLVLAGPDYQLYDLLTALSKSVVVNSYADLLKWVIIPRRP